MINMEFKLAVANALEWIEKNKVECNDRDV
ncbi:hypothetical protein phiOC_p279 [Ochrobactrum phage vB_OspM_OC]|nr:hypothetical protein phiOC_p279 [Ochrobactrum phage vB_OspM_OC]